MSRLVSITYDLPAPVVRVPAPGEFMRSLPTRGPGTAYRIVTAREVRQRTPRPSARFALRCVRVELGAIRGVVWPIYWHPRNRRRRSHHQEES